MVTISGWQITRALSCVESHDYPRADPYYLLLPRIRREAFSGFLFVAFVNDRSRGPTRACLVRYSAQGDEGHTVTLPVTIHY